MSQLKVHHLNCGTLRPRGAPLLRAVTGSAATICHCLLLETDHGLVLVDAGIGAADLKDPEGRLGKVFARWIRPDLDPAGTAMAAVSALGFSPRDVTHVVLTHLDVDHAGGLSDFPRAQVHLSVAELAAGVRRETRLERTRYSPVHWAHGARWITYPAQGERWMDTFDDVCQLEGLPPELLLVPLPGHTRGHSGVAVSTDRGWLLHAGDAYVHAPEAGQQPPWNPALKLYHRLTEASSDAAARSLERLRTLTRDNRDQVQIFCSHDLGEFSRLSGKTDSWRL